MRNRIARAMALLLVSIIVSSACLAATPAARAGDQGRNPPARLSVFFQLAGPATRLLSMRVVDLAVQIDDQWLPLLAEPLVLDARQIGGRQLFVARIGVEPGFCRSFRLTVEEGPPELRGGTGGSSFRQRTIQLPLATTVTLEQGDSKSFFLYWDVDASVDDDSGFYPALSIAGQPAIPLMSELLYVACPEINTVYQVRTDSNRVVASLGVNGRPSYLAVDDSRRLLYVLCGSEAFLKVIDLTGNQQVDRIFIPLVEEPVLLAMYWEKRWAYILDRRSNYIVRLDLDSGALAARVKLGERPEYAAYLADSHLLAVSAAFSNTVYLLDPESLLTVETIPVGGTPGGVLENGLLLYIAESSANIVTVYDMANRRVRSRIVVGLAPTRLLKVDNRIYVANSGSGTVSIIVPGQARVVRENRVGSPLEMAYAENRRWVYIGDEKSGNVTVVEATTGRVAGRIELGARPMGMAVME
ncbi:MAG: YncE family protein [Desulfobacterales bacterium]|nr:YncE family protein [Desulfobacterales bacterium]